MDEENMSEEMDPTEESPEDYPGIQFTPPDGMIGKDESSGDALARWEKVGDRYTITHLDGKKVGVEHVPPSDEEVEVKKDKMKRMTAYQELDQMAQL